MIMFVYKVDTNAVFLPNVLVAREVASDGVA